MRKIESVLILLLGILAVKTINCQVAYDSDSVTFKPGRDSLIFTLVEQMPRFPGGDMARIRYMSENIKYPKNARENGIQGRVFVTFVVEQDGTVNDVRVLRGIGGGCDEEAVKVVKSMPKWTPGFQKGKPVRVQFNMPILFRLPGSNENKSRYVNYYEKGLENMNNELYEEAVKSFSKSIEKKGSNYKEAYCTRGICRYQLGYYELAAEDLLEAQNIGADLNDKQVAVVSYLIANEFFIRSKLTEAIELYTQAIQLHPEYAKAYYNRGLAHYQTGDTESAKSDWKKAGKLGFDVPKNMIK